MRAVASKPPTNELPLKLLRPGWTWRMTSKEKKYLMTS